MDSSEFRSDDASSSRTEAPYLIQARKGIARTGPIPADNRLQENRGGLGSNPARATPGSHLGRRYDERRRICDCIKVIGKVPMLIIEVL